MKQIAKRSLALFVAFVLTISLMPATHHTAHAAGTGVEYVYSDEGYIYNWGTRGETATSLSPNAEAFYAANNAAYDVLSVLSGGTTATNSPGTDLYTELYELMSKNHNYSTSYDTEYGKTRDWYQYTDCQNSGKDTKTISSFYSGLAIGPAWDGGTTWNREHTWPNSKDATGGKTIREADIMMLRPASTTENGARGNKAYGDSIGFYHPNEESNGALDLRGDVARIALYIYVRWGGDSANANGAVERMWGSDGVIESLDVLLTWMAEDPVDTWELGRNDSVQSITGTRNVFVDYPELAFLLFGAMVPNNLITPSGEAAGTTSCQHNFAAGEMIPATCTTGGHTVYICSFCGLSYKGDKTPAAGHNYENGKCSVCHEAEPVELVVVNTPVAGKAYKFGMVQKNVSTSKVYYLTGVMSSYYMDTTADRDTSIDVYLEETSGGYYLYTVNNGVKTYINMVTSGSYVNGAYQATASTVYTFDAASKTLIAQVNGTSYWFGTRNDADFTTVGPCATSYNGFYCQFYGESDPDCQHANTTISGAVSATCTTNGHTGKTVCSDCGKTISTGEVIPAAGHNYVNGTCASCGRSEFNRFGVIEEPVADNAYKFGMVQKNVSASNVYYLTGVMDGYYMATTTDEMAALDVYLEETVGGYYLYTMNSGVKTYINMVTSGSYVNGAYQATASTVYTFDATNKTLIAQVNGSDYWFGTRNDKTYTTVGPCATSYNGFYCQLYGEPVVDSDPDCQHTNTTVEGATAATCTEPGHTGKTICTDCGKTVNSGTVIPSTGHNYVDGTCTYCGEKEPAAGAEVAVTVSIRDYAAANGWSNSVQYKELKMDDTVTVKVSGSTNTGKYYTSGNNWRIYQTEKPSVVISAGDKTILSVKITYTSEKNGVLTLNGSKITSNTVVDVNASSVTFGVGNTGTATNGQVRITAIEVIYAGGAAEPEAPVCQHTDTSVEGAADATCTEAGHTGKTVCAACGEVLGEGAVIPALGHNFEGGVCTRCGEKDPSSSADEVTVTVSIRDYAAANGWSNSVQYKELKMDDTVTVKVSGSTNTGKYYTSGNNWRIYQTEKPSVVISAGDKTILSVKITYTSEKNGVLTLNGSKITSNTVVDVNASSVTFGVGNTGTATNGQVRITAIEVIYAGGAAQPVEHAVTFVGFNGEVLDTVIVKHGEDATAPEAPVVEGYNFLGWDAEFTNITESLTVTAQYEIKTYTVKFILPAGGAEYQTVKHGETIADWANFIPKTNPEYTFLYWKYETGGEKGAKFDFTAPVTGDVVLRAAQGYSIADRDVALTATYGDETFDLGIATLKNSRHPNAYSKGQNIATASSFAGWDNFVMPECPSITIDGITYTYGENSSANYYVVNVDAIVVEKDPSVEKGYMFAAEVVIALYHSVTFYLPAMAGGGSRVFYVRDGETVAPYEVQDTADYDFKFWYKSTETHTKGFDFNTPITADTEFTACVEAIQQNFVVGVYVTVDGENVRIGTGSITGIANPKEFYGIYNNVVQKKHYSWSDIDLGTEFADITVNGETFVYGEPSDGYYATKAQKEATPSRIYTYEATQLKVGKYSGRNEFYYYTVGTYTLYYRVTYSLPTGGSWITYVKAGEMMDEYWAEDRCFAYEEVNYWYNSVGGAKLDFATYVVSKPVSFSCKTKAKWGNWDVTLKGTLDGETFDLGTAQILDAMHAGNYRNNKQNISHDASKIVMPELQAIVVDGVTYTYGAGSSDNYYTVDFTNLSCYSIKNSKGKVVDWEYHYTGDVVLYHKLVTVYTTVNDQRTGRVTLRSVEHGTVLTRELLGLSEGHFIAEETVITAGGTIDVKIGEHTDHFACRDAGTLVMVGIDDGVYKYECAHCGRNFRSEDGTQAG